MFCFVFILAYPGFFQVAYTFLYLTGNWIIPQKTLETKLSQYNFIVSLAFLIVALIVILSVCPLSNCILASGFAWPQWFGLPRFLSLIFTVLAGIIVGVTFYYAEASTAPWWLKLWRSNEPTVKLWIFGQTRRIVTDTQRLPAGFLLVIIASKAMLEEILWRGYLVVYAKDVLDLPALHAVVISSFAFGINHFGFGLANILSKTLLGGILCMMYLISGSLIPSILCHQVFNLMVFKFRIEWEK